MSDIDFEKLRALAEAAKPNAPDVNAIYRARYDHGGGRMWQDEGPDTGRELILDVYCDADSREFYFYAKENMLVLLDTLSRLSAEARGLREENENLRQSLKEQIEGNHANILEQMRFKRDE